MYEKERYVAVPHSEPSASVGSLAAVEKLIPKALFLRGAQRTLKLRNQRLKSMPINVAFESGG